MSTKICSPRYLIDHTSVLSHLLPQNGDHVFLGGSLACGFFNDSSDVDVLYIVGRRKAGASRSVQLFGGNRRVDVQYYSRAEWLSIARKVADATGDAPMPSAEELTVYFRSSLGIPMWNQSRFQTIRARSFSPLKLSAVLLRRNSERRRDLLEQISAALALQAWDEVRRILGELVVLNISSYCARRGENCPNVKWRYEMLARIHGKEHPVLDVFRELEDRASLVATYEASMDVLQQVLEPQESLKPTASVCLCLAANVSWYQIGDETIIVSGSLVHRGRGNGFATIVERLASKDGLRIAISPSGGNQFLKDLLVTKKVVQLVFESELTSKANMEMPEDPIQLTTECLQSYALRRLGQWRAYIDLQSYRDDWSGAAKAGQLEAALIAARRELKEAVGIVISERAGTSMALSDCNLHRYLQDHVQDIQDLLMGFPCDPSRLESCADQCHSMAESLLSAVGLSFPGNIREVQGHSRLFEYGGALFQILQRHGSDISLEPIIIEKIYQVAGIPSGKRPHQPEEMNG